MLKVTIDLWPFGRSDAAEPLGTIILVNDGTGDQARASYEVTFACTAREAKPPLVETVKINEFDRRRGVWDLLHTALGELVSRTEPDRQADFWLNR